MAYGLQAEAISKYVHKGDKFGVIGKINTRNYEKNGIKAYATEIFVESFEFLENKKDKLTETEQASFSNTSDSEFIAVSGDDDLPF